jgi:hypothetical protein
MRDWLRLTLAAFCAGRAVRRLRSIWRRGWGHMHGAQLVEHERYLVVPAERRYGVPGSEEQRKRPAAAEDLEEPTSAGRRRLAEDRALQRVQQSLELIVALPGSAKRGALRPHSPSEPCLSL